MDSLSESQTSTGGICSSPNGMGSRCWQHMLTTLPIKPSTQLRQAIGEVQVLMGTDWGPQWAGLHVRVRCDNMGVVHIFKARTSNDPMVMYLFRSLHFFCAKCSVRLTASHNLMADGIVFFVSCPKACQYPITAMPLPYRGGCNAKGSASSLQC